MDYTSNQKTRKAMFAFETYTQPSGSANLIEANSEMAAVICVGSRTERYQEMKGMGTIAFFAFYRQVLFFVV